MKVLITRPRAQADGFATQLREAGFESVFFPVIEIRPVEDQRELENAIANLEQYAWVIFTSVNAVDVVLKNSVSSVFSAVKTAAVGRKTADALRKYGVEPDFIPDEFTGANIVSGLGSIHGKRILLSRSEIARKELPEAIINAGGIAHEIVVYRTLPAAINQEGLSALKAGVDVITFTSPSTVENFVEIMRQRNMSMKNRPLIACIGTVTEQAAKEAGFENIITAKEFTTDGLVSLLVASRIVS